MPFGISSVSELRTMIVARSLIIGFHLFCLYDMLAIWQGADDQTGWRELCESVRHGMILNEQRRAPWTTCDEGVALRLVKERLCDAILMLSPRPILRRTVSCL